mgnify:CR=1 FL=1
MSRASAWGVLAAAVGVFTIATWVSPPAGGTGAHEQLGFAPCSLLMLTGVPCPTCGMTTSFAHFVRGEFIASLLAQPAGFAFAMATVIAAMVAATAIATGRAIELGRVFGNPVRVCAVTGGAVALGWAYKVIVTLATRAAAGA